MQSQSLVGLSAIDRYEAYRETVRDVYVEIEDERGPQQQPGKNLDHEVRPFSKNIASYWSFNNPATFAIVVSSVYFAVAMIGIFHHEMWSDEFQAWLIARDSTSLSDLINNVRYEGSGILWYLLLSPLAKITRNPYYMQLLHIELATACVYLVCRYSPFTRYQKLLFPFGYFILFEYSIISRCYVLGNLLLFALCAVYQSPRRNTFVLLGILALLSATSVYGVMLAIALGLGLSAERLLSRGDAFLKNLQSRAIATAICILVLVACIVACILLIAPPSDGFGSDLPQQIVQRIFFMKAESLRDFGRAVGTVLYAYLPIPATDYHFWETSYFRTNFFTLPLQWTIVSAGLFFAFLYWLRRYPMAAITYGIGSIGLVAFSYLIHTGAMRHYGQLYILLLASVWLVSCCRPVGGATKTMFALTSLDTASGRLLTFLLLVQSAVGIHCFLQDFRAPFSQSVNIARYLKQHHLENAPILCKAYFGVDVCALLDRTVNQIDEGAPGFFWHGAFKFNTIRQYRSEIRRLSHGGRELILVGSNLLKVEPSWASGLDVKLLKNFNGAILTSEDRLYYLVKPRPEFFLSE